MMVGARSETEAEAKVRIARKYGLFAKHPACGTKRGQAKGAFGKPRHERRRKS